MKKNNNFYAKYIIYIRLWRSNLFLESRYIYR